MKFHIFLHTFIAPEVASHDFNGESLLHACAKRNEELLKRCAWEPLCCVPVWGTSSPCWRCRCKRVFCLQPRTWCEGRLRWALACWQSWYQLLKGEKPPVLVGVLEQYVTSDLIAIIEGDVLFSYCFLNLVKKMSLCCPGVCVHTVTIPLELAIPPMQIVRVYQMTHASLVVTQPKNHINVGGSLMLSEQPTGSLPASPSQTEPVDCSAPAQELHRSR